MSKIDEMVRDGLAHHQAGRRDAARALYLKALLRQPSHPAANHLLGLLFLTQGEAGEAVKHLQRAVRGNRSAEYLGNLGTALNAAGRPAEAVKALTSQGRTRLLAELAKLQPANAPKPLRPVHRG